MENKRISLNRRDTLKVIGLAGAALLTGCNFANDQVLATDLPISSPLPSSIPTLMDTETPVITETPTPTLEEMFKLGEIDLATTPFVIKVGPNVTRTLDHFFDLNPKYESKIPLPVYTEHVYDNPEYLKIFKDAATNHTEGNPYFVILTDKPNHKLVVFHASQKYVAGDFAREVARWVSTNPERVDELYGQKVTFEFGDPEDSIPDLPMEAEIVFATWMTEEYFYDNYQEVGVWGNMNNEQKTMYGVLDKLLISKDITEDNDPNNRYVSVVGCSSDSGLTSEILSENHTRRAVVTFKFTGR